MSSQLFDAQLLVPDNNESNQQLFDLTTAGNFTGRGLPDVAHKYLDAFCNKTYSSGRRRWVGIALVGMMRASPSVIQRLKKLSRGRSQIGATILDREETEECRIVAGLIIRQGLEAGIDFADFWTSSKLLDSALNFPKDSSGLWMSQFQTYLDTLSDLVLTDFNNDAMVLYPISLSFKGGLQWAGRSAVAIIEKNALTIVIADSELTDFRFVDIPLGHITETSLQQESPHESQEGRSGRKMHTLTMKLQRCSPNYQLNTSNHTTSEFKMSFQEQVDANEFQSGLEEAHKNFGTAATQGADAPVSMRPHKDSDVGCSDISSVEPSDEPTPPEQLSQKQDPTQRSGHENGRGKLPSISKATKQKAVRAQQLPCGASKVTKARAAKNAAPIYEASEHEDESEELSQDEYGLKATAQSRKSVNSGTARRSQGRRKAIVQDEDFVPNGSKAKSTSNKRKRASSDATEQSQRPKKKTQTKSNTTTGSLPAGTTTKKQKSSGQETAQTVQPRTREPMMQSSAQQNIQNGATARHSLIGGLVKSKSPSKAVAPTFKKPGQPASTPGRPRSNPVRTTPKPQTPHDTPGDLEDLPVSVPASTPRSRLMHEEDFGVDDTPVNSEVLSSNTKRVPDSPHAESTAISCHADQDDVHREKRRGDLETAKNDPFQQRREGQRITTFTRKLTAEGSEEGGAGPDGNLLLPVDSLNDDFEVDDLKAISKSQVLLKQSPSLLKQRAQNHLEPRAQKPNAQTRDSDDPSAHNTKPHKIDNTTLNDASRSLRFESSRGVRASQSNTRAQRQIAPMDRSSPVSMPALRKERRMTGVTVDKPAEPNDSVVSAPREAIEDTLLDAPEQEAHAVGLDGETTLVGEDEDMPEQHTATSRDLRFRSSPPLPDSSSVRDASPNESQPEPEPSPPTSRVDELEWEDALQPHQRDLHEQLLRTSKRVMRHIVDNETAVTDIADVFAKDGERLLNLMIERQNNESAEAFQNLASKKQDLLQELSDASENVKLQRKQIRDAK